MRGKKVAVVSPSQIENVNETFIRAHVELVKNTEYLYGGRVPYLAEGGGKVIRFTLYSKFRYKFFRLLHLTKFNYNQFECYSYLKRGNFDVILAEYGDVGAEMMPIARKLKLELLVHFHGADISMKHILDAYKDKYKLMFSFAKNIFSVSNQMTAKLIELGCNPNIIIRNSCTPGDHFFENKPNYNQNTVVALGGFVDQKAPYFTVMAFNLVLKEIPDAILYFGGSGPLYNASVFIAENLGINKNIVFNGFVNPEDCKSHLAKGSIFVQHSVTAINGDTEGMPVSILEAMASGLPIVSTNHAGIPEVIKNGHNGFVVEEKDVNSMAEKIIFLLKNPSEKEKFGQNARETVNQNYRMNTHIERIQNAIDL